MAQDVSFQSIPISFAERAASSDLFKTLFPDGMALVEETAAYLDGEGRDAAKSLPRSAALAYASESMRLTTRLMQMASWLLLQRAVNEGELSQVEALSDKKRTCVAWSETTASEALARLPEALRTLIDASLRLQERLLHLDALIRNPDPQAATPTANPVEGQLSQLRAAFCR